MTRKISIKTLKVTVISLTSYLLIFCMTTYSCVSRRNIMDLSDEYDDEEIYLSEEKKDNAGAGKHGRYIGLKNTKGLQCYINASLQANCGAGLWTEAVVRDSLKKANEKIKKAKELFEFLRGLKTSVGVLDRADVIKTFEGKIEFLGLGLITLKDLSDLISLNTDNENLIERIKRLPSYEFHNARILANAFIPLLEKFEKGNKYLSAELRRFEAIFFEVMGGGENWNFTTQNDADEFIIKVCDVLSLPNKIEVITHKICTNGHETIRASEFQHILNVNLPIGYPANFFINLQDCVNNFFNYELLSGNERVDCSECNARVDHTKKYLLKELPQTLTITPKRFLYDHIGFDRIKINNKFEDYEEIELFDMNGRKGIYSLNAAIIHHGISAHGGHYTTIKKDKSDGTWWLCNDKSVHQEKNSKKAEDAYLFLYDKVEGRTRKLNKKKAKIIPVEKLNPAVPKDSIPANPNDESTPDKKDQNPAGQKQTTPVYSNDKSTPDKKDTNPVDPRPTLVVKAQRDNHSAPYSDQPFDKEEKIMEPLPLKGPFPLLSTTGNSEKIKTNTEEPKLKKKRQKHIGLPRKGYTCYINAAIQSMYEAGIWTPETIQKRLDWAISIEQNNLSSDKKQRLNDSIDLAKSFISVLNKLESGDENIQNDLDKFEERFFKSYRNSVWDFAQQHDVYEFIHYNTELLFDPLSLNSKSSDPLATEYLIKIINCFKCKNNHTITKNEIDNFIQVQLGKTSGNEERLNFQNLLDQCWKEEKVDDWKCENCDKENEIYGAELQTVEKYYKIESCPKTLPILAQRFIYDGVSLQKMTNPLENYETIKITDSKNITKNYNLKSYICHGGITPESGHYIACAKDDNGLWREYNDNVVTEMKNSDSAKSAYMLIYERED